jgi:hypothetical protein
MQEMSTLKKLICHLYESGEVSRKDFTLIAGTVAYARNILANYADIMKVVGTKSDKTVRLMQITSKNEKHIEKLLSSIDPRLFQKWREDNDNKNFKWVDTGSMRQRAFKRSRASYFMRTHGMEVDSFSRPPLSQNQGGARWIPGQYFDATELKKSKEIGQNEINASSITGLLYLGGCAYSIYWFEIPDDLEKIRPGTEEKMRTHIRTLVMKYAERHDAESKAICIIPKSIAKNISIETICKNIPKQYLDVYILTSDSEGAQQAFDVLSMSRHIRRAQLSIFNEDDIITTHRYDHATNKDTICQVGVIPNARALQYIKDKTKKGSQHKVWSIQKIPDYDIHILKGQHTLYQDLLPGQTGIILKSHNPDKLIGLMRSLEEDMLDF